MKPGNESCQISPSLDFADLRLHEPHMEPCLLRVIQILEVPPSMLVPGWTSQPPHPQPWKRLCALFPKHSLNQAEVCLSECGSYPEPHPKPALHKYMGNPHSLVGSSPRTLPCVLMKDWDNMKILRKFLLWYRSVGKEEQPLQGKASSPTQILLPCLPYGEGQ